MKIIVDMMGGDNAPLAVLEGAAAAVKEYGVQLIGVGDEALVRKTAADNNISLDGIELVNCTEVIEMCDEPARAIRTKKDSSIVVGLNMLKEGKGDAFVSAGSTGAPAPKAVKPAGAGQGTVSGEKKRSRHRPRRRSGGSKPNGGTEA